MAEPKDGCVKPAGGVLGIPSSKGTATSSSAPAAEEEAQKVLARVGHPAPDFEVNAFVEKGFKNVKLSDYKGKWVVLCFYPGDFTFVWPTELSAVAVKYHELKAMDVEILAMSVDSRFSHKVWQEEELSKMVEGGVPFPMLTDPGGNVGQVYGVYDEAAGVDIRGRFIIDPEGTIRAMEVLTAEVGRNVAELVRQVKAFQYVAATGEVTPSGWQPGKPALTPGPSLVGKVWTVWRTESAFD